MNILITQNDFIIIRTNEIFIPSKNKVYKIDKPILQLVEWGNELVARTKSHLFFISKDIYKKKIRNIIEIAVYREELYILKKSKFIVYGSKKRTYRLKNITPVLITPLSDQRVLIAEKNGSVFLVYRKKNTAKHVFEYPFRETFLKMIASFQHYDLKYSVKRGMDYLLGIVDAPYKKTSKKGLYKEEIVYLMDMRLVICINLSTLVSNVIDFSQLNSPAYSVNDDHFVISCSDKVIIYNKRLTRHKIIYNQYKNFTAIKNGFVYVVGNKVCFTKGTDKESFFINELDTQYKYPLNPFFTKDNFHFLRSNYEFDCSDSRSYSDEYGDLLKDKIEQPTSLPVEEFNEFIKPTRISIYNKAIEKYRENELNSSNEEKIRRIKFNTKILCDEMDIFENYFWYQQKTKFSRNEKKNLNFSALQSNESKLYAKVLEDHAKLGTNVENDYKDEKKIEIKREQKNTGRKKGF